MMDTRIYDVIFSNGSIKQYLVNPIADLIWANCDEEWQRYRALDEFIGYKMTPDSIEKEDGYFYGLNGQRDFIKTTKGYEFEIRWCDGQTSWISLKDAKELYPVEMAEYSLNIGIKDKTSFRWWILYLLKKADVVSRIKQRSVKKIYKFGIRVPHTMEGAYQFDRENINHY